MADDIGDLHFELVPELSPEEERDQGLKKTHVLEQDRDDVYYSGERTGFGVNVRVVYIANGFADVANGNNTRASLIILDVWLHSVKQNHRFEEMEVTFALEDDPAFSGGPKAEPQLGQWAPFRQKTSVNRSVEKQVVTSSWGGEIGGSYYLDLKTNYNQDRKVEKEAVYHEEWQTSPTTGHTGVLNGIRMSGLANKSQNHTSGLFGTVRFGVLIQRKDPAPWIGRFRIRTFGGFWENIVSTGRRWLGLDPRTTILKIPSADDYVHASMDGQEILKTVDRNKLILYLDYKELANLVTLV